MFYPRYNLLTSSPNQAMRLCAHIGFVLLDPRRFLWMFNPASRFSLNSFHASAPQGQNPNHRLYKSIDWDKIDGGLFAVVDPADTSAILYLSDRDYKIQVRVSLSTDSPLVVLARAGEVRLTPANQASKEINDLSSKTGTSSASTSTDSPSFSTSLKDEDSSHKNSPPKGVPQSRLDRPPRTPRTKEETRKYRAWKSMLSWPKSLFSRYYSGGEDALIVITTTNIVDVFSGWSFLTYHWASKTLSPPTAVQESTRSMAAYLKKTLQAQGSQGVIRLLKFSSVILRRFLAGNPVKDAWELGHPIKVTAYGLPRWFPPHVRRNVVNFDVLVLRWLFSILNCYKAFHSTYKPINLKDITDTLPTIDPDTLSDFTRFCKEIFWGTLVKNLAREAGKTRLLSPNLNKINYYNEEPALVRTGSPNGRVSVLAAALDTIAWGLAPVNWLKEFLRHTGDSRTSRLFDLVSLEAQKVFPEIAYLGHRPMVHGRSQPLQNRELGLGKLSLKLEAAGKKRVFAIVDYWSQRALQPLHNWMMDILRLLPSDATFDQNGSVALFAAKWRASAHSYDLKAATDTIPQTLYEVLLKGILPEDLVDTWLALLTDRWFLVPPEECTDETIVKYTRGQPMGALSSWPAMALVHHAIVLYAAWKSGVKVDSAEIWDYRVLGDDVVIGSSAVGERYVTLTELLHIKIGKKVSLISDLPEQFGDVVVDSVNKALVLWSNTTEARLAWKGYARLVRRRLLGPFFEFANQFWLGGINLSPMSLKQEIRVVTPAQRFEYALRTVARWGLVPGESWVARLCRLLLTPSAYVEANKWWRKGQLGPTVQVALITAFGPASALLRRMGFQWSSFVPLLLALANSCTLLGADQSILSGSRSFIKGDDELCVNLVIMYTKNLIQCATQARNTAQDAQLCVDQFLSQAEYGTQELRPAKPKDAKRLRRTCLELVMSDHFASRSGEAGDHPDGWWGALSLIDRYNEELVDFVLYAQALLQRYSSVVPAQEHVPVATPQPDPPVCTVVETKTSYLAPSWGFYECMEDEVEEYLVFGPHHLRDGPFAWNPPEPFKVWAKRVRDAIASGHKVTYEVVTNGDEDCPIVTQVTATIHVNETVEVLLPEPITVAKDASRPQVVISKALASQAFADLEDLFSRFAKCPLPRDLSQADLLFTKPDPNKITDLMRKERMNMDMIAPAVLHSGIPVWLDIPMTEPEGLNSLGWWTSISHLKPLDEPKKA
jgi:hypothetical protein